MSDYFHPRTLLCAKNDDNHAGASVESEREAAKTGAAQPFSVSPALGTQTRYRVFESRLVRRVPESNFEIANGVACADGSRTGAVFVAALRRTIRAIARGLGE